MVYIPASRGIEFNRKMFVLFYLFFLNPFIIYFNDFCPSIHVFIMLQISFAIGLYRATGCESSVDSDDFYLNELYLFSVLHSSREFRSLCP